MRRSLYVMVFCILLRWFYCCLSLHVTIVVVSGYPFALISCLTTPAVQIGYRLSVIAPVLLYCWSCLSLVCLPSRDRSCVCLFEHHV